MITPVILSGGSSIRLWPLSRKQYTKQLPLLLNQSSLLHDMLQRYVSLESVDISIDTRLDDVYGHDGTNT